MPKTTVIHGGCVEKHVHNKGNKVTRISTRDDPFAHKGTYRKDKGTQLHMVIKERGEEGKSQPTQPKLVISSSKVLAVIQNDTLHKCKHVFLIPGKPHDNTRIIPHN